MSTFKRLDAFDCCSLSTGERVRVRASLILNWQMELKKYPLRVLDEVKTYLAELAKQKTMTQLIGRVLRQPFAERTEHNELNESYVYCLRQIASRLIRLLRVHFPNALPIGRRRGGELGAA